MQLVMKYQTIYRDDHGIVHTWIENDFNELSIEIEGVQFKGTEFSNLAIVDQHGYSESQLQRFTLHQTKILGSGCIEETLCNCCFELVVPQTMILLPEMRTFSVDVKVIYSLGNVRANGALEFENINISVILDNTLFEASGDYFETVLDSLTRQFEGGYQFKNCYGCMFGDYSAYGQSSFGTMQCYHAQKEAYLRIKDKSDYLALCQHNPLVQEIDCCDRYEIREKGGGYRG